jgi:hypothetical protein
LFYRSRRCDRIISEGNENSLYPLWGMLPPIQPYHAGGRSPPDRGGGIIERRNLITLRRGELVTDIVNNTVGPSVDEVIKIKEKNGAERGCLFYDGEAKACAIYDARPLQCTVLKCWDNREILEVLGRPRLKRRDVIRRRPSRPDRSA